MFISFLVTQFIEWLLGAQVGKLNLCSPRQLIPLCHGVLNHFAFVSSHWSRYFFICSLLWFSSVNNIDCIPSFFRGEGGGRALQNIYGIKKKGNNFYLWYLRRCVCCICIVWPLYHFFQLKKNNESSFFQH